MAAAMWRKHIQLRSLVQEGLLSLERIGSTDGYGIGNHGSYDILISLSGCSGECTMVKDVMVGQIAMAIRSQ